MDRNDHLFVDKLNSKNHIYQYAINTTYKNRREEMSKPKSFHHQLTLFIFFSNLKIYQYAINTTYKNRKEEISKPKSFHHRPTLFFSFFPI